jgi:hypothetical protein
MQDQSVVYEMVTFEYLEMLRATIDKQKGQLSLALAVLVSLGFNLADAAEVVEAARHAGRHLVQQRVDAAVGHRLLAPSGERVRRLRVGVRDDHLSERGVQRDVPQLVPLADHFDRRGRDVLPLEVADLGPTHAGVHQCVQQQPLRLGDRLPEELAQLMWLEDARLLVGLAGQLHRLHRGDGQQAPQDRVAVDGAQVLGVQAHRP